MDYKTGRVCVSDVMGKRTPLKIFYSVVVLVPVLVIDALRAVWLINERRGDNLMNKSSIWLAELAKAYLKIPLGMAHRRKNHPFSVPYMLRSGFANATNDPIDRFDATKIGYLVEIIKSRNRFPDFLHGSLHQREVITEGARQGGDESPFRPLRLAAQGGF